MELVRPDLAMRLGVEEVLDRLEKRHGPVVKQALHLDEPMPGPLDGQDSTDWMKRANIVGVNVRTAGSFWKLAAYCLSLPDCQDALHLLPIWEPGVVSSLYGPAGWKINDEFFSPELAAEYPWLDSVEKQLAAVVRLLHATGRAVGLDVVPHADRYGEQVLANPSYFEWLRRRGTEIVEHGARLHEAVEEVIEAFLEEEGPALDGGDGCVQADAAGHGGYGGYGGHYRAEQERLLRLFGPPGDRKGRLARRLALIRRLYDEGLETVPATMAPPYRGLVVDDGPGALHVDACGMEWRDYRIAEPTAMSRVFGPLTRYKLYGRKDDNRHWEIDFDRPRVEVWDYVSRRYGDTAADYGFDFMRGDMAHVQMRPEGAPRRPGKYYDILGAVKEYVRDERGIAHFAYFAEAFLGPPDCMCYGDEEEHLEAAGADAVLGDLQSAVPGSEDFTERLSRYDRICRKRSFAVSFTVFTADKDDPRFDRFFRHASGARLFAALGLGDRPSYMGMGFELRDARRQRAANEFYSKLYVFQAPAGHALATKGPWRWGGNTELCEELASIRKFFDEHDRFIRGKTVRWLHPPGAFCAWTQQEAPELLFLVNFSESPVDGTPAVVLPREVTALEGIFPERGEPVAAGDGGFGGLSLPPGGYRAFRLHRRARRPAGG